MTTETAILTYTIDPAHSVAEFAVKHLMISTVKGAFRDLEGVIHIDQVEPQRSSVDATICTDSIDTGVEMRDDHLRSDDFLDVERFPTITFRSTSVERSQDGRWRIAGELTLRGVSRLLVLDTAFEGRVRDPWGRERIGFTATTSLNRRDFGLTYSDALEAGRPRHRRQRNGHAAHPGREEG
jgi:polyisoprenoid-binding protein YceI